MRPADAPADLEHRVRALADSAPALIWTSDEAGRPAFFNAGWLEFTGHSLDEELAKAWIGVHPDDVPAARKTYVDAVAGRAPYEAVYRLRRADGEYRWVLDRAARQLSPEGTFEGFVGVAVDITERKRAEAESESMAAFPRLNPNPVLLLEPDGTLSYANEAAERMASSLGKAEVRGILPADLRGVLDRVLAIGRDELALDTIVAGRALRWLFFPVDGGRSIHCYVTDVTERKAAEEALRDREERFRTLVANIPGTVYRCANDESWTMDFMSEAIVELSGYPVSDFVGNAVRTFESVIHPDDRARVADTVAEGLRENRPFVVEYRIVRADGAVRWVYEKGRGVLGTRGETLWIDGAIFDVTDRKRAEEAARRTTSLLETLIDNLRSGILVVGEDMRVGYVNDVYCRDLDVGIEPGELAGKPARDASRLGEHLFPDPERYTVRIDEIVAAREAVKAEELELTDGRVIERDYVPVAVGDGSTVHLWQHRDITDRKRVEQELAAQNEELRALDRVKDEFLALISHELRTPLTSIIGYLELLRDEGVLGAEELRFVGVVERNARRLLRLVGDLLFVAQIEAGKLALELGLTDLAQLAAECVEAQRPRAAAAEVDVTLELEGPVVLHADRARLGQLLDNLVSNAIKFTLAGGAVRVRVSGSSGAAVLEVSDSGIGIPAQEAEKLFGRFFRASTATSREIQGTGLGLTITKAIAEGHGGRISFASEEGAGTTFRVELPLAAAADRAA